MSSISTPYLVLLYLATVILALLAFAFGRMLGQRRRQRPDPEAQLAVRTLVASILGLLSFILGFTFGLAANHFDARNQAVADEVTAIGTAYRRADLLAEPERADVRTSLREYVDLRAATIQSDDKEKMIAQLRQLQERIWNQVAAINRTQATTATGPLLQSLVEVIEVHSERVVAGVRSRIGPKVWIALYWIMSLSLGSAGYLFGLAGTQRSITVVAYSMVFATVIVMIAMGDSPGDMFVRTNHRAMLELRARLTTP